MAMLSHRQRRSWNCSEVRTVHMSWREELDIGSTAQMYSHRCEGFLLHAKAADLLQKWLLFACPCIL